MRGSFRVAEVVGKLALVLMACDDGSAEPAIVDDAAIEVDAGEVDAAAPDAEVATWCEGPAAQRYDPLNDSELGLFPDPLLARDAEGRTGRALEVTEETAPWLAGAAMVVRDALDDLNELNGFGTGAGVLMRFTEPVAPADGEVTLWDLGLDPPEQVPVRVELQEGDKAFVVQPLRPLRPGVEHAAFATRLTAVEGGCVAPSEATRALLEGTAEAPRLAAVTPRYAAALEAVGVAAVDVSAATVFRTQDELPVLVEVAADIRARTYQWTAPVTCEEAERWRHCEGSFEAWDYRDDRHVRTAAPKANWTIPVSLWIPKGEGPFPTLVYGHGIGDRRQSGRYVAERVSELGIAVVAADALRHGEHPTAEDPNSAAISFLGLNLQAVKMDAMALRGNFNQTALDRLQLVQLVQDAPDVDGDGTPDLDGDRLAYWGISLGGMLGSATLALGEDIDAGILSVAGGSLLLFVTDTAQVAALRPAILTLLGGEAAFERLLPVLQTLVDAADPATFGAFLLRDRLNEAPAPHVLFPVAVEDETVPPSSGRALARAMGIPHVGPVSFDVALLEQVPAPVSANVGGVTAGYFQFDRVSSGDAGIAVAGHNNTPLSREGWFQARRFLESWLEEDAPEIVDPFEALGTPPLLLP